MTLHVVQQVHTRPRRYESPSSVDEVLAILAAEGDAARVIAGGTDLLLEVERGARPTVTTLVDLGRVKGLNTIAERDGVAHLGPLVTHNDVVTSSLLVASALPLAQACWEIGSPALRNRATVAGNVITASPANDTLSALHALDASVVLTSVRGDRRLPLGAFLTGFRQTALQPDELLTDVQVPLLDANTRGIFVKLGLRRAQAISVVHLAVVVRFDGSIVRSVRGAVGSVASTVVTVPQLEPLLAGRPLDDDAIEAAVESFLDMAKPLDDIRASASYRAETLGVMVRRALDAIRTGNERACWPSSPPTLRAKEKSQAAASARGGVTVMDGDAITATINGRSTTAPCQPAETLLDWLRFHAHHTDPASLRGTKEGCAEGECGACTVHLDGDAVLACLVPAGRAAGAEITTVEGLADVTTGSLHPVQQAFIDCAAVQCGYCTPGFLMAAASLIDGGDVLDDATIRAGLAGNLCRCTGYYRIVEAVAAAAARSRSATPEDRTS